jgi:hypothetical protein
LEALYHFIRASTAGLYQVLYRSPLFFIDCWSFVHLLSGMVLMALAMRFRVRRRWTLLAAALLAYEALEIAFVYASVHLFFPETFPDQFTDIVVGLAGAGMAASVGSNRSPAGAALSLAGGVPAGRAVER